jgi:hypothetical protein
VKKILAGLFLSMILSGLYAQNESLPINHFRVTGSHNSYKRALEPSWLKMLQQEDMALARSLDYTQLSLTEQLDRGLRALELDVHHDPQGGRYRNPLGNQILRQSGIVPQPYDLEGKLDLPGLKVFHIQDIDFRSYQLLFKDALKEVLTWSEAHPDHFPIYITMNAKDEIIDRPDFRKPLPFTSSALDSIDLEIRQVIPASKLLTPDVVRGSSETLEKAVLTKGWPRLQDAKGKILFVLDERGEKMETYRKGHPSLQGRVLFVLAQPGEAESAFMIMNDAKSEVAAIKKMVAMGYMVRTRADLDTQEARHTDYSRFDAAKASGAQIISTDYYWPSEQYGTDYQVIFKVEPNNSSF